MALPIDRKFLAECRAAWADDEEGHRASNALTRCKPADLCMDWECARALRDSFSVDLWDGGVTDQGSSERCWAFSGLNLIRHMAQKKLGLRERNFQLSQNYIYFYDQLEKSSRFIERILELRNKPLDDRELAELLRDPISPRGEWCNFSELTARYGVVPKCVMPDTACSSDNHSVTRTLSDRLRRGAWEIRENSPERPEELHREILADVYGILCRFLGEPPEVFDFSYCDVGGIYHTFSGITPQEFMASGCGFNPDNFIMVINHPSAARPFGLLYTEREQPPAGHDYCTMLNEEISAIKRMAAAQLRLGEQVVFGADVSRQGSHQFGILDAQLYGEEKLFGAKLSLPKAEQIAYRQIAARHVMTLDGVELDARGTPLRWKVQNSYGEGMGVHGHYLMSDSWFDAFVLTAVIDLRCLAAEELEAAGKPPVYLPKEERY